MSAIDLSALLPNAAALLVAPLLFVGIIGKAKGLWAGRRGPRLLQPFLDVGKLLGKGEVLSTTTSAFFRAAPSIELAAALGAAALVPMAGGRSMVSFEGDFVLFAYLLAAGRFAGALAALDTGSSFAGMGSAREVLFSALAEPAFFAAAGTLALIGGTASFASLFAAIAAGAAAPAISLALCAAAFFLVLLVEGSRLPVDDPTTHLELTMVHEAMILDYSGPDLAFIQCSVAVKMLAFACLAAAALVSPIAFIAPAARDAAFFGLVAAQALAVGAIESIFARLRMTHVPQFILLAAAIALIALAVALLPAAGGQP